MRRMKLYWKFYLYYAVLGYGLVDGLIALDIHQVALSLGYGAIIGLWHSDFKQQREKILDLTDKVEECSMCYNHFSVRYHEKKFECLSRSCMEYLDTIGRLKDENKQLKILNKNLIENKRTGVKNYARGNR